jgi:hypothetical protein
MLAVTSYKKAYVDECRAKVGLQLSAYRTLIRAARRDGDDPSLASAVGTFEPVFFNNMVLALDHFFLHRTRAMEMKDGNPLNEVRMLCNSIMENNGVMQPDKTIKYDPVKSVARVRIGDEIRLSEDAFSRLAEAFFDEIEKKYP